jgi:hypothetical protein
VTNDADTRTDRAEPAAIELDLLLHSAAALIRNYKSFCRRYPQYAGHATGALDGCRVLLGEAIDAVTEEHTRC